MKIQSTRPPSIHRPAPKPSAVAAAIGLALASQTAIALPEGGQVVAGQVAIQRPDAASLGIGQSTPKAVVDWQSFSIASGEAVRIQQPSTSATLLNRVVGEEPSRIFGQLSANGQVFLINPAGVMFAPGARLDVGSLTASTLKLSNEDFLAGRYHFTDGEKGGVVDNQGQIRTREGGYVALLGRQVVNSGSISAPGGNVALGAGDRITLDLHGDGLLALKVDAAAARAKVSNTGTIDAEGGSVALSAHAKNALVDTVLNVEGTVRATGISQRNGEIYLDGGDSGTVTVSGTLDASGHAAQDTADTATARHGGKITVIGETLALTGQAKLDATGDAGGGEILVGGGRQGQPISPTLQTGERPGVRATAKTVTVEAGVTLDASATQEGQGGTAVVYAEDDTRFAGSAKAEGGALSGDGGFVETSAHRVHIEPTAKVSTLAPKGRTGEWLTDPDDYTIASSGGNETGAQVSASLASTNRAIQTTASGTGGNGNINVNDAVTWNNGNSLTLSAYHLVNVNAAISSTGTGGVTLRADNTGAAVAGTLNWGTVAFTGAGHVTVNGGNVGIYYNPTGSTGKADANGNIAGAYASPTDYTGKVSLGTGSTLFAYMLVNDVNQLQSMGTNLGGTYALGKDIDAAATNGWNGGAGFVPVGNSTTPFTGTLDGLGHTITGLAINRPTTDSVGLFGSTSAASGILNVGLQGGSVTGQGKVGALAGENLGGITRAHSSATVSGTSRDGAGGLVGWNEGPITDSYATGNVAGRENILTGNWGVGGLVGENSGPILRGYATGQVSGNSNSVGGLLGANHSSVTDSYATGNVVGGQNVGGLVGWYDGTITNSYSTGNVNGTSSFGGLVGLNFGGSITSIINSFWDTDTSGQAGSAGGTGLTTAQMQRQTNFTGWDYTATWGIVDGASYPYLQWQFPTAPPQIVSGTLGGSNVSGHTIQTAVDGSLLAATGTGANGYFYLALPNGRIANGTNLLAYLASSDGNPAAAMRLSDGSTMAGLDLAPNLLTLSSNSAAPVSLTNLLTAKGGLNTADIPYSFIGNNLILSNGVDFQTANGTRFILNGDINAASQTYNGPVNLAVNATLSSGSGNIRFNNGAVDGVDFDLTLFTSGIVSQSSSAALNVSGLELLGVGGIFNLADADNRIGTLAAHTGMLRFKDNAGFNIGSVNATAGITTGGDVTLDSAGTVTQSQAIDAPGLELVGGGRFDLAGANNHIITLAAHASTLRFKDSAGFNIGSVNGTAGITASGDVTLDSAGTVTQTEAIVAAGLALLGNGNYFFGLTDNAIATLAGHTRTVRLHDSGGFAIGTVDGMAGLAAGGGVALDSSGTVTQSQAITAPSLELLGGGRFDLADADNHIATLAARASTLWFKDNAGFNIGSVNGTAGITANGDVTLDSTGTVTQTESIAATGLALLGNGGDYRFGQTDNAIATLAGNTGTVRFHDSDGFAIGTADGTAGLAASGGVALDSSGTVTQSQAITAAGLELLGGGAFNLASADNHITTLAARAATLRFKDNAGFNIGSVNATAGITASGDVTLDSAGTVTQTEAIATPGLALLGGGGDYRLNLADNPVTTLAAHTGTLRFKHDAGFNIGSVNGTAGITASGDVALDSTGTVTQTESIAAAGLALLGNGGDYRFGQTDNAIATLAGNTGTVRFHDSGGFAIGTAGGIAGLTTATDVTLDSAGPVTQSQAIDAPGLELLGGGAFNLADADNRLNTLAARAATLRFKDNTGFTIGSVNSTAGITASGDVTLDSNGTVTQTKAIAATGLELLNGTFTLTNGLNNVATLAAKVAGGPLIYTDSDGLVVGTVNGTVGITNGDKDVSLKADGTVTLNSMIDAGAGRVDISTSQGNIVGGNPGNVIASNTRINLNAAGGIGIGGVVNTDLRGTGTLTLTTAGTGGTGNIAVREARALNTLQVASINTDLSAQTLSLSSATGAITLDGDIGNTKDDLNLTANSGDIVGGPGKAKADNLTLSATGDIGRGTPVNTDTLGNLTLTTAGTTATGNIAVIESNALETSRVFLNTNPFAQQVSLASKARITLDADIGNYQDDLNLSANGGDIAGGAGRAKADNLTLSATGDIGRGTPVNTDTLGNLTLATAGTTATGDIAVIEANALETSRVFLNTNPFAQQVSLASKAGITLDADIGNYQDDLNLTANGGDIAGGAGKAKADNLTLSATGGIGTATPVNTDTWGNLTLTAISATATGDIAVIEANALETSRVVLNTDSNSTQQVSLASNTGITLDADIGNYQDDLDLTANGGNIVGGAGKAVADNLTLSATGDIGIGAPVNTDTLGTLTLTTTGTTAAGNIAVIEANALKTSRVVLNTDPNSAQWVSLTANTGSITLDANIGNTADDLYLIASQGSILSGPSSDKKAFANFLVLQAQTGIGSKDVPVLTAASSLFANNVTSGDVAIRNDRDVLAVGSNGGDGVFDFTVNAGKTLTVNFDGIISNGGAINLTSDKISTFGEIASNGGAINLTADEMNLFAPVSAGSGLITLTPSNTDGTAVLVGGDPAMVADGPGVLSIDSSEASLFFGSGGLSIINPQQGIQFTGAAGFFGLAGGKLTFSTDSAITRDPQSQGQLLTTDGSTMINLLAQTGIGQGNNPIVLNTQGGKMFAQNNGTGGVFLDFRGTTTLGGDDGSKISSNPSGIITVTSSGDIIMHGIIGDGLQPITLQSLEGGIFGDSAGLVFAPDITLLASQGIGAAEAPLNTQASGTLTLGSTSGGIFIKNQGSVKLATAALASDAPLSVVSTGTLTMPASAITAGTIDLESQGGRLNVKGELFATNGEIKLLGSLGISLANNLTTNNGDITLDGAVALPVDPTINAGSGNVGFKQTLEGPQNLTINTSGTVSFAGAVGTNSPLAYLSVTGGGPTLFASNLVRTTGSQAYQGPVTGTDMRLESTNGDITAANPLNQFNNTVSASGNIVNLTADRLNVGLAGITGRQINLTANAITTLGTIRSTGTNPGETGLSLVGLADQGRFGTIDTPLAVDVNNRFTVSPDSFDASIVYLTGPTNAGITFDSGPDHRQIDYNGSLSRTGNLTSEELSGELLASRNATFGVLPNSVKSANKVVFEMDYGKDLPLRQTEIVALGLRLPGDKRSIRKNDKPELSDKSIDTTLEPTRLPLLGLAKTPVKGDFNTRLMVQLERWFTLDSGIAMRPLLEERLQSGYARENVRKRLAQGIVLETGVAAAALSDITDEGVKLQNKRSCGAILLASWSVSAGCAGQ